MKLSHLFEAREQTIPVEVEYEYEDTTGEEVESHNIVFEIDVTITPDQYGTGDSPEGYTTHITKAYYAEGGKSFNWKALGKKEIHWIEDKAIDKAMRQL